MTDGGNALITGASNGIGLATARALGNAGHHVFVTSRSEQSLRTAVKDLEGDGITVDGTTCDVREPDDVRRAVGECVRRFGPVRTVVNNAGRPGGGMTARIPDELWTDTVATNLNGTFFVTKAVLDEGRMTELPAGRIIMMASAWGKQGVVGGGPYAASKHGVIGFARSLALEVAATGITVNAVCPGYVETPMAQNVRACHADLWRVDEPEVLRRVRSEIPIGRYSEADEVADMVVFLASDRSASVTGQTLNVCGGLGLA